MEVGLVLTPCPTVLDEELHALGLVLDLLVHGLLGGVLLASGQDVHDEVDHTLRLLLAELAVTGTVNCLCCAR